MGMRKVGLKKALPVIAGAVVLAILMICFVLPASAFELSSDMMGRVQSFLSRSEHDTLDKAALADFALCIIEAASIGYFIFRPLFSI